MREQFNSATMKQLKYIYSITFGFNSKRVVLNELLLYDEFMKSFDVVTVGDSILDTFLHLHNASDFAKVNQETEELCIRTGSKVLLDSADFCLGGNASNVAVGLSRMGLNTTLIAELGDDEFSQKLISGLNLEKVNLDFVKQTKNASSTFSVILDILGDRTAFIRHVKRDHELSLEGLNTKWIYLTSVGKDWHELYKNVLEFKKSFGVKLAFNPGSAQIAEGPESFEDIIKESDILFVNRDEAEIILHGKILSKEERETEENLLFRIQRKGAKMIVMTDGENGSYVMDEKAGLFYEKSAKCKIVEKTGAGDAYSSGFLGAILLGKNVMEAMRYGAVNAAGVIEHIGATSGLLTMDKIISRMTESTVEPKELEK